MFTCLNLLAWAPNSFNWVWIGGVHFWATPYIGDACTRRWLEQSTCWLWSLVNEKGNASPSLPTWHSPLTWHSFVQFDLTLSRHLTRRSPCSTFKLCFNLLTRGAIQRLRTSVACASKLTLHLSKARAPIHCFIHLLHFLYCSSSPNSLYDPRFLSRVFDPQISRYSKRYDLSSSLAPPFSFRTDTTAWDCLFFLVFLVFSFAIFYFCSPSPFLSFFLRVGILVRFLFLPPFLSSFGKTFSHLYSSVSSPMARTKTTANPPPLNVNYRDLYSWAPVELLDECSSLVSTKA